MTRITVINPNTSAELTATITAAAQAVAGAGVTVTGVNPPVGMPSVESHAEEAIAALGVLEQVHQHRADSDAFVVACFGDTGVLAAREVATCPVVGMTEAALQTACLVAHRFVVITLPARTIAHSERVVRALGLEHRCSVIAVDVPVAELVDGSTHLLDAFAEAACRAIAADHAEAVVLGCAGLADLVDPLSDTLGVPVIDGVAAAVGIAAGLVAMRLNTSRANTFAAVPGLPWSAHDRAVPSCVVYDAAAPGAMTGPRDVLVDGDRISAVGDGLAASPGARIVDGGGRHLLVPGLINAHFHSPANHLKGSVRSLPLELFMLFESPADPALAPEPAGGLPADHARRHRDAATGHHLRAGRRLPDAVPRPGDHRRGGVGVPRQRDPGVPRAGPAGADRGREAAVPGPNSTTQPALPSTSRRRLPPPSCWRPTTI